jgi:prevent-host-death family protein
VPTVTTISSRTFNQDLGHAKRAANDGPVIITDRGQPAYVLLTHDAWQRLRGERRSVRQLLALPGVEDIDFEPGTLSRITTPVDLS